MGNSSFELSIEEQEQFEMQIEDEYNPIDSQSAAEARTKYLERKRTQEA